MVRNREEEELIDREARGTAIVGYAFVKYSAIVVIVLAILYFLANYILPRF